MLHFFCWLLQDDGDDDEDNEEPWHLLAALPIRSVS